MKKRNCAGPKSARLYLVKRERWRIQERGPGSPALLILDQNEARRAENNFFLECPPYLRVWMTAPSLHPLI